ncbi:DUF952 domain-containing protein [Nocardia camponoti]|uniref:Glutathione S-transferase n=1 Tax=Nocardia camponoti TaxID=1616106 RepID=A0A917V5V5_9NOCA|nr:DUF952 domain-containing protein [Nocardia camponoti]GGK41102.1 glutathione S-transferase [Nocardia camponoti]
MTVTVHTLVHLCSSEEWDQLDNDEHKDGYRRPPSLAESGFVHLSTPDQVHLPANRLFAGRDDMVLLWIDAARLTDEVKFEPGVATDPDSMRFPHLYGPLPRAAVVAVTRYVPGHDGIYRTPQQPSSGA